MTVEGRIEKKEQTLEKKMAASVPVFDRDIIFNGLMLSQTEFEIIRVVCSTSLNNLEIAELRNRSPQTIKNHFTSIYRKLDINTPGDRGLDKRNLAIVTLIELGALRYKPSVDTDTCSIVIQNGR